MSAAADPMAASLAASLQGFDAELADMVLDELRTGRDAEQVLTAVRQEKIAQASNRIEHAAVDGLGEVTMRLDPTAYHYWGQRLGYDCWSDKQFKREFLRDNPAARVQNRYRKATVQAPGTGHLISPRQPTDPTTRTATSLPTRQATAAPTTARTTSDGAAPPSQQAPQRKRPGLIIHP